MASTSKSPSKTASIPSGQQKPKRLTAEGWKRRHQKPAAKKPKSN